MGCAAYAERKYGKALSHFREASKMGHAEARYNIGMMHVAGKGVLQDSVYAYMYLNLAAASGFELAADARDRLKANMTAEQVAEAQRLCHRRFA